MGMMKRYLEMLAEKLGVSEQEIMNNPKKYERAFYENI